MAKSQTGDFRIYPDWSSTAIRDINSKPNLGDYPIIKLLDPHSTPLNDSIPGQLKEDFSSTLSKEGIALVSSWLQECKVSHSKCRKVFKTESLDLPDEAWFPDRLIQLRDTKIRIVVKSSPLDFSPEKLSAGVKYLSLSHCWGPPPDPSAWLGGRTASVLTELKLPDWQKDIPIDELPLTFRDAVRVCSALGYEYIWIDSLCIMQDSREDWHAQSAVMADVYKFAWLNIAALTSISDYDGFVNENRDPRFEFGFRAPFASILGREKNEINSSGQKCVLLRGKAKLHWASKGYIGQTEPLTTRAWVYQERALARRTLDFTQNRLRWSCDEFRGDECDIADRSDKPDARDLRWILHEATRIAKSAGRSSQDAVLANQIEPMLYKFDMLWHGCVVTYSACQLTKHSDKLIAISSVARELAGAGTSKYTYLAGLWDVNLVFQLAWITVIGRKTPPRKRIGVEGYVAPSWSWASIEALVQPCFISSPPGTIALADVLASKVELETDFEYGSVKAGWIRMRGRLNGVRKSNMRVYNWSTTEKFISLTDEATDEKLWLSPDTLEGLELVKWGRDMKKLAWMPLTVRFNDQGVSGFCLCLVEVEPAERIAGGTEFVRADEKVFRRIGTGNFGRVISMLKQDKLLMSLGTYPETQVGTELAKSFERSEDGFQEFVII